MKRKNFFRYHPEVKDWDNLYEAHTDDTKIKIFTDAVDALVKNARGYLTVPSIGYITILLDEGKEYGIPDEVMAPYWAAVFELREERLKLKQERAS